jgi:hypothetical protein
MDQMLTCDWPKLLRQQEENTAAGHACMLEGTGTSGMLCTKAQGQSAAWGGFLVDGEGRHPSKLISRSLNANVIPHPASLCSKVYRMGSVKWLRIQHKGIEFVLLG